MEDSTKEEVDELADGYRYNGENPWLLPSELPTALPQPRKSNESGAAPVPRRFNETESFLTTITTRDEDELFRLPISLPKPRAPQAPQRTPCHNCKNPATHRHHEGGRALRYVCAEHAKEARDKGYEVFGPPLTKT